MQSKHQRCEGCDRHSNCTEHECSDGKYWLCDSCKEDWQKEDEAQEDAYMEGMGMGKEYELASMRSDLEAHRAQVLQELQEKLAAAQELLKKEGFHAGPKDVKGQTYFKAERHANAQKGRVRRAKK